MHTLKVVPIAEAKRRRDMLVEDVWNAYLAAKTKADATGHVDDAIAAGKLWKRFLELFVGPF